MSTFVICVLILLVVAPTALVLGLRFAWFAIKKLSKRSLDSIERWLVNNGF